MICSHGQIMHDPHDIVFSCLLTYDSLAWARLLQTYTLTRTDGEPATTSLSQAEPSWLPRHVLLTATVRRSGMLGAVCSARY